MLLDSIKIVTGTAVAATTLSVNPLPVHPSLLASAVTYILPFALSILSHLVLNLFKSTSNVQNP